VKHTDILDSWKAISEYLDRDVRTCRRWEAELGLPVYRINADSTHSKVFAYQSEIDEWLKDKANNKKTSKRYLMVDKRIFVGAAVLSILLLSVLTLTLIDGFKSILSDRQPTLAVFPFSNANRQDHEEYFSQSIMTGMIKNISRAGKIKVIPVSPMAESDKEKTSPHQIAQNLGADYMLVGQIEKQSKRFSINIQVLSTKGAKKIWEEKCDGELKEILNVQNLLCAKLHEKLGIYDDQRYLDSSAVNQIQNYDSYDNYLKGNFILDNIRDESKKSWKLYSQGRYFLGGNTRESNDLAIHFFNEAVKLDESFGLAFLGLAQCYLNYINFNWDFDSRWLDKAEEMTVKAEKLAVECPEYFTVSILNCLIREVGFCEDRELNIDQLVKAGIAAFPNDAQLNSAVGAFYFFQFGKTGERDNFDRAMQFKEKSFWLDPTSIDNVTYAEMLMLKEDFEEALAVCDLMSRNSPSLLIRFRMGEIYYYMGELEKSLEVFEEFQDAPLDLKIDSLLYAGMIAAQKNDEKRALAAIEEIELLAPEEFLLTEPLKMASIYFGSDRPETAYRYLDSFFVKPMAQKSHHIFCKYINIDRNFEAFREQRRFIETLKIREETDG
jgi:TolB-like protein